MEILPDLGEALSPPVAGDLWGDIEQRRIEEHDREEDDGEKRIDHQGRRRAGQEDSDILELPHSRYQITDATGQLDHAANTAGAAGRSAIGRLDVGILSSMAGSWFPSRVDTALSGATSDVAIQTLAGARLFGSDSLMWRSSWTRPMQRVAKPSRFGMNGFSVSSPATMRCTDTKRLNCRIFAMSNSSSASRNAIHAPHPHLIDPRAGMGAIGSGPKWVTRPSNGCAASEWDTAAGHAILNAAGGCMVARDGAPLRYGKPDEGFKTDGFIAWGRQPLH
jgi:Inositol monophosphatase family